MPTSPRPDRLTKSARREARQLEAQMEAVPFDDFPEPSRSGRRSSPREGGKKNRNPRS